MARTWCALLLCLWLGDVAAQDDALQGLPSVSAERERIDAARQRALAGYADREAACYQRFAVNRCLSEVQSQRRATLAGLQREEQVLSDAQRRQRAAAQLRLNEEKAQDKLQKDSQAAAIDNAAEIAQRQAAQADKQRNHASAAQGGSRDPYTRPTRAAPTANAQARAEHERKQQEAVQRQRDADQRLREKAQAQASKPRKPLPIPP